MLIGYNLGGLSQYVAQGFRVAFMVGGVIFVSLLLIGFSTYMRKR